MIQNFDQLKGQLTELASVINQFKSEAVQLRVIELILTGAISNVGLDKPSAPSPRKSTSKGGRRKAHTPSEPNKANSGVKKSTRAVGPATILAELIDEKYFDKRHTISDILAHSSSNKARNFKANEFSPALARFVRDGRLKREKNADGQYEYFKP